MKKIALLLICCFFIQISYSQDQVKEYDRLMSDMFNEDGPGAVALIVKDGKTIYRKAFGMANLELEVKMTPVNIFRIGSITKQFTASAILKLRDEGKLSLDDDITKYLVDYPTHGHKISIKHLLTHTSGIKSYTGMEEWTAETRKKAFTPEELIEFFKFQPMEFKPGEQWSYNNSAYFILGYIIELVSGMTYEEYIDTNFFKPLEMTNSYYGSTSRIIKNRAYGYNKINDEYINADYLSMTQPYSAGALLSTVDDLYKWYSSVMDDKVISRTSREEAQSTYILNNGEKTGYGYGWAIGNIQGSPTISHDGGINGFLTSSIYLTEEDLFVAVFSNCNCNSPGNIAIKMAALALEKPYKWEKITLDKDILKSYEAVYETGNGDQLIITYKDGQLFSMRTGGGKYEIFPFEKDKFFYMGRTTTLNFKRGPVDEIVSVLSKSTGYDIDWERTDKAIPTINKIDLDSSEIEKYLGKYELSPEFILTIFMEESRIYAQATGQNKIEIIPFEENRFSVVDVDAKITFNLDADGVVDSLILHQNGDHQAKKIE